LEGIYLLIRFIGLDLDITDPRVIKTRILNVLLFKKHDEEFLDNPDLSGPFILGITLGLLLLLVKYISY
jgi:hypothetical protein